jgi:hypothetical protein
VCSQGPLWTRLGLYRDQSNSLNPPAANDPRSLHAANLNSKSCDDISFKTLHLFQKIKVFRRPVETAALYRLSSCLPSLSCSFHIAAIRTTCSNMLAKTSISGLFRHLASSCHRPVLAFLQLAAFDAMAPQLPSAPLNELCFSSHQPNRVTHPSLL